MDHFTLLELLLAFDDVFGGDTTLGKVDVACYLLLYCWIRGGRSRGGVGEECTFIFFNPHYHGDLVPAYADDLLHTPDATPG